VSICLHKTVGSLYPYFAQKVRAIITFQNPSSRSVAMAERNLQKLDSKRIGHTATTEAAGPRPEVIVEFLFESGLLYISIKNIGARPAINVAVKFNKPLIGLNGAKDISALALFRNIEFLGPGREIVSLLDSSSSYFKRKQPTKVSASISYRDLEKRPYETTIKHDLEIYRELPFVSRTS